MSSLEMIILSMAVSVVLLLGSFFLNKISTQEKLSQYECGFEPLEEKPGVSEPGDRFYVNYYIIGIIFLIFDLEAILLYPFTTLISLSHPIEISSIFIGYFVFFIFMLVLILGLIYEYKKGVFS